MDIHSTVPQTIGTVRYDNVWQEYMYFLYLPVRMPEYSNEVRLPTRLSFVDDLVDFCIRDATATGPLGVNSWYVYVSARHGYATPDNPLNRPGWHIDGFGTDDINYIWTDRFPTRGINQSFLNIDTTRNVHEQFDSMADEANVVELSANAVYKMGANHVHATPIVPSPGGDRRFIKVSMSPDKYNLYGNSHNYKFPYNWQLHQRLTARNDPNFADKDFYK